MGRVRRLLGIGRRAARDARRVAVGREPLRVDLVGLARAAYVGAGEAPIVVIGDSLAERAPWSAMLDRPCANRGFAGMRIAEVAEWARSCVPPSAERVLVWARTNDALDERPGDAILADVDHLVEVVRSCAATATIHVLTLPPLGPLHIDAVQLFNQHVRQLEVVEVVEVTSVLGTPRRRLCPDGIHVNGEGYDAVAPVLRSSLFGH